MSAQPTKPKVFISYSHPTDDAPTSPFVTELARVLRREGIDVHSDQDLIPGDAWEAVLPAWRREADILIFVFSVESNRDSSWCHKEIDFAKEREQPIIPVRFDDSSPLPDSIRGRTAIDFRRGVTFEATDQLVAGIKTIYGRMHSTNQPTVAGTPSPVSPPPQTVLMSAGSPSSSSPSSPSGAALAATPSPSGPLSPSGAASAGTAPQKSPAWQILLAFAFGVGFLLILMAVAIFIPNPTPSQYSTFRIVLALAAAGEAAVLPGFLSIDVSPSTLATIRASGALAVFVIVYFFSPALIPTQSATPTPTPTVTPTTTGAVIDHVNTNAYDPFSDTFGIYWASASQRSLKVQVDTLQVE